MKIEGNFGIFNLLSLRSVPFPYPLFLSLRIILGWVGESGGREGDKVEERRELRREDPGMAEEELQT